MFTRIAFSTLVLFTVALTAQAQTPQAGGPAANSPMANSGIKLDQSPLLKSLDTDKDGKLSKAEWTAGGGTENIFTHTDKNNDGSMTLAEMNDTSPPDMADADKDGKFTLSEFQAMIKASAQPPGGSSPAGAPPAGTPQK
jgi:hypothetical protein